MAPATVADRFRAETATAAVPPVLSIILPARNEAAGIRKAISTVDALLADLGLSYEIIVGDSASTDGTGDAARAAGLPHLMVVRADRPGKGLALTRAMLCARGSLVGFIDSDLEISVEYLRPAVAAVLRGADAAIGSKALDPRLAASRSLFRRAATRVANRLIRFSLGTKLTDHQAGLKVFRRESLMPSLRRVRATGWLWDTELLAMMCAAGASVEEIAVETSPNRPSRLGSVRQLVSAAFELTKVCMRVRWRRSFAPSRTVRADALSPVT